MGSRNSVEKFLDSGSELGSMVVKSNKEFGWNKFRYCPRQIGNLPREKWTISGYRSNNCVAVVGKVGFSSGTEIKKVYKSCGTADQLFLVPGSLEQVSGVKLKKPLNDENGVTSSLSDLEFEFPEGKLVKPSSFNHHPLYFYSKRSIAEHDFDSNLNFCDYFEDLY